MSELFPEFQFKSKPEQPAVLQRPASSKIDEPNFVPMSDFWAESLLLQAKRFRDLEPWNKIRENEFIGIEHPQTGEVSLISVLGRGHEIFALHYHKPPQGLHFWRRALEGKPPKQAPAFEHLHMFECEFVSKEDVSPKDLAFVKRHGKPSRKRRGIPCFRSYRPGFFPWELDDYEALELSMVFDLFFLYFDTAFPGKHSSQFKWAKSENEDHQIPTLKLKPNGSADYLSDWEVVTQPIPEISPPELTTDLPTLDETTGNTLELYLFSQTQPTKPRHKRPYFPTISGVYLNTEDQPIDSQIWAPTKTKSELGLDILSKAVKKTNPSAIKIYTDSNIEHCANFLASKAIPNQIQPIDPSSKRVNKLIDSQVIAVKNDID